MSAAPRDPADRPARPSRPRIEPVGEPDAEQRQILELTRVTAPDGSVANIFGTLARHPGILKRFSQLGGQLLFRSAVPAREREIVILRVGWSCRSVYEFGQHTVIGRGAGLTDDEIAALAGGDVASLAPHEVDLVALADDLCADDCVSDATWERLRPRWSDQELVELLVLAGFYRLVAGFLNSAGVQLDEGVPGWP